MIELKNLSLSAGKKTILNNINISFNDGEIIAITGRSGSGKSMLLKTITGTARGFSGSIEIDGKESKSFLKNDLLKSVSPVFCAPPDNMEETLERFLMLARMQYRKLFSPFSEYDIQTTDQYIALFGLEDFRTSQMANLSGCVYKRAMLAFSFIMKMKTLLIDNPSSDLDIASVEMLQKAASRYVIDGSRTVIIASNDLNFAAQTADRIIVMENGSVAIDGGPSIIEPDMIKKYFGADVFVSKNVYNGRPNVNLFPES
jgi:ABC-type cobalamin/Fe3+-siderophores transport system ATPase subunit